LPIFAGMIDDYPTVPWYTSSEIYEEFRAAAIDPDEFFATYEEWLEVAIEHERQAELAGFVVVRIRVSYNDFMKWCQITNHSNDSQGRSAFAEARAKMILL
jgi:hypothetical protein